MNLVWTHRAASDLRRIKAFIAYDKPVAAAQWIQKIKKAAERLRHFPRSGRIVPELSQDIVRELIVENYRIIYKITKKTVAILTVFEGHQLLKQFE